MTKTATEGAKVTRNAIDIQTDLTAAERHLSRIASQRKPLPPYSEVKKARAAVKTLRNELANADTSTMLTAGTEIKVRDRYAPTKSRRQATVIEDRGESGVLCYVHWRAARGGSWQSRRELVARDRIIR